MNALETDIIKLRALEVEDVDILYRWENDPNVWKVSGTMANLKQNFAGMA